MYMHIYHISIYIMIVSIMCISAAYFNYVIDPSGHFPDHYSDNCYYKIFVIFTHS